MKVLERIFFAFYIPIGLWACLHTGISIDELTEYQTLLININAVKGLFAGSLFEYHSLLNYQDRYYGIGFHLIANVFAQLFAFLNEQTFLLIKSPSEVLFTHVSVFGAFVLSGFLVKSILTKLSVQSSMANLGMVTYLLWPYLLGHSFFNVKDIPFLLAWLLATNIYLKILKLWHSQFSCTRSYVWTQFAILGLSTAWLLSIRISGVLIFIEYVVIFFTYSFLARCQLRRILSLSNAAAFSIPLLLGLFSLYPVFWHNPFELINAIEYMSRHPWDGDTLTAGRLLAPREFSYLYIPAWLLIKLPLVVIIGCLVTPLVIYKAIQARKSYPIGTCLGNLLGLVFSVVAILVFLVITKAGLYNELRQILFIFPLIYIIGFTALYYISKKILGVSLVITALLFAVDNIVLCPYQYSYINEVARQLDVGRRYEKDYFFLSAARNVEWLNQKNLNNLDISCVYVTPLHLWSELDREKYPCVSAYKGFAESKKPFLFVWLVRDRVDLLPLPTCELIHEEQVSLPLSNTKLVMSQIFFCNPVPTDK